jgi:predicted transposase/invertase (TIGR01784 family)
MKWLDPKLDVVFKLLFAREKNRDILTALLTAVLQPTAPIDSLFVLNPEVPKDLPADRGAVLDIHLRLADGRHIDVEMQSEVNLELAPRFLYYWARLHASQLTVGDHYEKLCPTLSVLILKEPLLPLARAHSKFRILEVETHHELTGDLEMHFVELSKIALEPDDSALKLWMAFLLARDEKEREELAMSNPDIRRATEALAELSRDPEAQELARQRELAQINLKIIRQFEREEGEAKGRAEGRVEGQHGSLRLAVEAVCDVLGIELDAARKEFLSGLDVDGLTRLLQDIRQNRRWP